jgi:hypothetical protein
MQKLGLKPLSKINSILKDFEVKTEETEDHEVNANDAVAKDYDYLLSMPLLSLSEERVNELER